MAFFEERPVSWYHVEIEDLWTPKRFLFDLGQRNPLNLVGQYFVPAFSSRPMLVVRTLGPPADGAFRNATPILGPQCCCCQWWLFASGHL